MSNTFSELTIQHSSLSSQKAVWAELLSYLNNFLDSDASPAKLAVSMSPDVRIPVPQAEIRVVAGEIQEILSDLDKQLDDIQKVRFVNGDTE
jgi:hypothetical protein